VLVAKCDMMTEILARWRAFAVLLIPVKILIILITPLGFSSTSTKSDFSNWILGAAAIFKSLRAGTIPCWSPFGVYFGIELILTPFFWVWTILPIPHPPMTSLVNFSGPSIALALLMKLPIFFSDIATGSLLSQLIRKLTRSKTSSALASLTWFANPFNVYWLYVYGAMDVIPTAIVLLALNFGFDDEWLRTGFCTVAAGLLRVFPFVSLPFLLPLARVKLARVFLIVGSLIPISLVISAFALRKTGSCLNSSSLTSVLSIPGREPWLLRFLGLNILGGGSWAFVVKLAPVVILVQLYVVLRYWRDDSNIVHLVCVSFLALMVGADVYGGSAYHFLPVSPLLSACLALHPREETWLYTLIFITAILFPGIQWLGWLFPIYPVIGTFLAGAFYAAKAGYLIRLNMWNFRSHHEP
jgi:hypothetical protein